MCGRYALFQTKQLGTRFHVPSDEMRAIEEELKARYNIGPSQTEPAIYEQGGREHIELMHWGFMPHWAHDFKSVFRYKTFNARSEEIFKKPTYRSAIKHTRCLVPSNGFYEWKATKGGKQPYFIRPKDQELFAFAGIYSQWEDESGQEWDTYSILTTEPNNQMEGIHDRMPVILHPDDEEAWLDESLDTPEVLQPLMQPYEDDGLEITEVSREVNSTRVDKETLVLPINSQ